MTVLPELLARTYFPILYIKSYATVILFSRDYLRQPPIMGLKSPAGKITLLERTSSDAWSLATTLMCSGSNLRLDVCFLILTTLLKTPTPSWCWAMDIGRASLHFLLP